MELVGVLARPPLVAVPTVHLEVPEDRETIRVSTSLRAQLQARRDQRLALLARPANVRDDGTTYAVWEEQAVTSCIEIDFGLAMGRKDIHAPPCIFPW